MYLIEATTHPQSLRFIGYSYNGLELIKLFPRLINELCNYFFHTVIVYFGAAI